MRTVKSAAFVMFAGALMLLISALTPWVTAFGVASAHLPRGGAAVVVILALASAAVGAVAVRGVVPVPVMVLAWVLAGLNTLVLVLLFVLLEADSGPGGSFVSPAAGFWLALFGTIAAVGGTITVQIGVSSARSLAQRPYVAAIVSDEGRAWWDGTQWRPLPVGEYRTT